MLVFFKCSILVILAGSPNKNTDVKQKTLLTIYFVKNRLIYTCFESKQKKKYWQLSSKTKSNISSKAICIYLEKIIFQDVYLTASCLF